MFFEGYKRTLSMNDLFAIDDDLKGTRLYERISKTWQSGKHLTLQKSLPVTLIEFVKSTRRNDTLLQQLFCGPFLPSSVLHLFLVLPSWALVLLSLISSMLQLLTSRIMLNYPRTMDMGSLGHTRSVILDLL
jgi:hypothetical protein